MLSSRRCKHLPLALVSMLALACTAPGVRAADQAQPGHAQDGRAPSPASVAVDKAAAAADKAADKPGGDRAVSPLKVAFVLTTTPDGSGWSMSHEAAIAGMREQLGDQVAITLRDNVPDAEADKVFRELAQAGNRLIIGTGATYRSVMQRLAVEFPEVRWEVVGLGHAAGNLRTFAPRSYEGTYLAGVVAGKLTETDTLGFIATVPIPEVIRNINAFALGAQSVNPSARVKVAWINGWVDQVRETEAAQSLIDSGADVLLPNTATANPLKVAERAGKYVFGWGADMAKAAPKAYVGTVAFNWTDYYVQSVRQVIDGRWKATGSWEGVKAGRVGLTNLSSRLPEAVRGVLDDKRKALASGSLQIWKGPLVSADDRELLPRGKVGDDAFLGSLMSYVKGVEGQVPSGK
ncbi:MAG: BMP family ABC transporter substrate-binding protein [Lautropia sp.]|nr:BMP family ABC transporter substrate-binding protein [Lautropia sp.]